MRIACVYTGFSDSRRAGGLDRFLRRPSAPLALKGRGFSQATLRMTDEQLKRLDDFRFEHRFFNRSETVRWLLDWALQHNPKPPKTQAERFPEPK